MDWFSRVCVARNLAAARGAQTGAPAVWALLEGRTSPATLL